MGQGTDKTAWNIGDEVFDLNKFGTEYNGDYSFDGAKTVTFKNMTLRSGKADYLGFIRANQTVVAVIASSTARPSTGVIKVQSLSIRPSMLQVEIMRRTYSSPTMTFDNCTFNATGKVINVYTDYGAGKRILRLTLTTAP